MNGCFRAWSEAKTVRGMVLKICPRQRGWQGQTTPTVGRITSRWFKCLRRRAPGSLPLFARARTRISSPQAPDTDWRKEGTTMSISGIVIALVALIPLTAVASPADGQAPPSTAPSDAAGPAVESGLLPVDGGRLFYETAGAGPAILLLHDGLLDHHSWDEQFAPWSRHYRVIRYDRRGFGRSTPPEAPYSDLEDLGTSPSADGGAAGPLPGAPPAARCVALRRSRRARSHPLPVRHPG